MALRLGATSVEFGILNALGTAPFLLIGLFVGVWVDRWPRRPILIIGDIGRGLIVAAIAVLFLLGSLNLLVLYMTSFLTGVLTVFFDVAYQAYVPSLVETPQLVDANSKLETTRAASQVAGPGLGAILVSFFTVAGAMVADAATFFVSGAFLVAIRKKEAPVPTGKRSMLADVREGLGTVFGDARLRGIAGCTATSNFFTSASFAVFVVFLAVDMGYRDEASLAGVLGLTAAIGSVGALLGAVASGRIAKRIGLGNAIVLGACVFVLGFGLLVLSVQPYAIPLIAASQFLVLFGALVYNVNQVSLRQALTPNRLQGRMNATMRFLVWGTLPIGAITGGILGVTIGLRETIAVSFVGGSAAIFFLLAAPILAIRAIPAQRTE